MKKNLFLSFVAMLLSMATYAISGITGSHTVCVGSSTTLMDSTAGGVWSSSNTSIAYIGSTGTTYGIAAGAVTITYTATGISVYYSFTVNPQPAAITGVTHEAVGGTSPLSDATPGGIWSSANVTIATVGSPTGVVTGVSAGPTNITYTISTGCYVFVADTVTGSGGTTGPILGTLHACVGSTSALSDTTAGGTWSCSNPAVATINATSGIVTGVAAGTCTIYYTHGTSTAYTTFTVNPLPAAITGPTTVAAGSYITLADLTGGGAWSSSNSGIATVTSGGVVTGVTAGAVTITYLLTTGCFVTYSVTVTGGGAVLPITGTTHVCVGSTTTLLDSTAGGTWTSSNTAIATVNATSGVVTGVSAGTCTISYTSGGTTVTTSFTVYALPAAVGGPSIVAVGGTITLTDATTGGTWISSNTSIATVNATTGLVTGVSAGTDNIYYTLSTGCAAYKTVTVTGSSILPITGTASACVGGVSTLHDSTSGGTYSSSNTSIATVNATSGVVTGVSAGTCTITYTVGASYVTRSFVVNPLPAVPTGPSTVAVGSVITLADASPGGTWFSGSTSIATVGASTGIVTGVSAGTVWIYYSLTTGCANHTTITVTGGGGTGILPITGTLHSCVGTTSSLHDSTTGGTWSSSNTSIATVNATSGVVTGVSAGTCTITYTVGGSYVTASFTVYALPASIAGPTTVAAGSTITLTDATGGGTWISSNTSVATVNATTGVVTGVAAGTVTIYYQLTTGCAATYSVTVTGGGTTLPITGTLHVCVGSSTTLMDSTTGGTWSSSNTAIATVNATTGVVTGVAAGTCTITYTHGSSYVTATFVVNPVPSAISGPTTVAAGASITLTDATTGGTWVSGNTSIATVNASTGVVTGVSAGTVNIYYTTTAGCGVYITVTVTGGGTSILPITGTTHACVGSTSALHDSTSGGTWTSSNTSIATVNATSGVVTGVAAGTCTISYTVGGTTVTTSFTVYALPAAITGSSTVCIGGTITLSDATTGGTWISGNTSLATVVSTSGVVTGVAAGTLNIYYQLTTGCGVYKTISVNASPAAISGSSSVCVGSTITLTDATSGGTWMSVYTAFATVSTSGVVTGVAAGTTSIMYTVGGCSVSRSITVNTAPAAITGSGSLCVGTSITLADATTGGTWISSTPGIATITSGGVVTGVSGGTVNIYYTVGSCAVYKVITVNVVPAAISGSSTVHTSGPTITLTDATAGGSWFTGNPAIATVGPTTGVVTGVAGGTVNIYYSIGGCAVYKTITVLSPAPPGYIGGTISIGQDYGNILNILAAEVTPVVEPVDISAGAASTEISSVLQNNDVRIFPNPSAGYLNLQYDNMATGNALVTVADLLGREVFRSELIMVQGSGLVQLNMSNLKDGIYLISVKSESVNFNSRISIQH